MAKRTKGPQADEHTLVEPRSFEELTQRAHDAALSGATTDRSFWCCLTNHCEGDHEKHLLRTKTWMTRGFFLTIAGLMTWAASRIAGVLLGPEHGIVPLLAAAPYYCWTFGLSLMSLAILGGYWSWYRRGRRCEAVVAQKGSIATHVTAYLGKLIAEEQRRCIGEDGEIERLRKRMDEVLDRARTLRQQLEARMNEERTRGRGDRSVPAYLTAAFERAGLVVMRLTRSSERLSEHRAKLDAFFQECKARVQAAEKPLQDLELVEAVEILDTEGERLGTEVQDVIIRSTGELFGRLQQLRLTLVASLAHAGVHLALNAPMTGNLERDTHVLEDAIARFRPPKIVERDDATAPRAQAGGPIGIM